MTAGVLCCFFFNDTATTEIYTLSLHDALPIYKHLMIASLFPPEACPKAADATSTRGTRTVMTPSFPKDRKSTRLNSSHANISYAVFCLKKKTTISTDIYCFYFSCNKLKSQYLN